jgi:hypothetical protein
VPSSERADGAGFQHEWLRGGNDIRLQFEELRRRPGANASNPKRTRRYVVEFERLQLHRVDVGGSKHLFFGSTDFVKVHRTDETLEHGDVRTVRRIQGETFGVDREQPGIVGFRMWSIMPSGSSRRSMAVTGFCSALDVRAQPSTATRQMPSTARALEYSDMGYSSE